MEFTFKTPSNPDLNIHSTGIMYAHHDS